MIRLQRVEDCLKNPQEAFDAGNCGGLGFACSFYGTENVLQMQ